MKKYIILFSIFLSFNTTMQCSHKKLVTNPSNKQPRREAEVDDKEIAEACANLTLGCALYTTILGCFVCCSQQIPFHFSNYQNLPCIPCRYKKME